MTAVKIIGGILLLLLLLARLRIGVIVDFGGTLRVRLRVGPVRRTILPGRAPKKEKGTEKAEEPPAPEKKRAKRAARFSVPKLAAADLRDLAETVLRALGRTLRKTCRRTRIDPLEIGVTLAGEDPADLAQTYGYANAALWSCMPVLEALFTIPAPSIYLGMDFDKKETAAEGTVGAWLRLGDLLAIALTLALPVGRWFLRYRREHPETPAASKPQGAADAVQTEEANRKTA